MSQQEVHSWFVSFLSFQVRSFVALTDEERLSVEEEKACFFKEIGIPEGNFYELLNNFLPICLWKKCASTDEERQSAEKEMDRFFKAIEQYKKALDEQNHERHNSIPPAA